MWIRKTQEEIDNTKFKVPMFGNEMSPIKFAGLIFILIFLSQILLDWIFGDSTRGEYFKEFWIKDRATWGNFPDRLPDYIERSLVMSILFFILTKIKFKIKPTSYICDNCNKIKKDDKNYSCECGGSYIRLDHMKWVEEEKE